VYSPVLLLVLLLPVLVVLLPVLLQVVLLPVLVLLLPVLVLVVRGGPPQSPRTS
jgi:hypothetical protein